MGRRTCGPIQAQVRKAKYAKQFATTKRNKRRRVAKHYSLHPGDRQALADLKRLLEQ